MQYVEDNGLLHPSHHGSRSQHSTCTALIEMYDTWIESVERGEMAGVMMLSKKLSDQYKRLAEYMGDNKLVINDDKTHLLVMGTTKHDANRGSVTIDTGTCIVKPVPSHKLLVINITNH